MCKTFGVSRAGYAWLRREPSARAHADAELSVSIKAIHRRVELSVVPLIAVHGDFRFWLQAAARHIVIYVGFTSSTGNSDAELPLLEALRT